MVTAEYFAGSPTFTPAGVVQRSEDTSNYAKINVYTYTTMGKGPEKDFIQTDKSV
jgi:hypothetical protein